MHRGEDRRHGAIDPDVDGPELALDRLGHAHLSQDLNGVQRRPDLGAVLAGRVEALVGGHGNERRRHSRSPSPDTIQQVLIRVLAGLPHLLADKLTQYPDHPLAQSPLGWKERALALRGLAQQGDPAGLLVFDADRDGRAAAFKAIELASAHQMRTRVATVTPPAVDWADYSNLPPNPATITLSNTGQGDLVITEIRLTDATTPKQPSFVVTADGCSGRRLAPTASCQISVKFTPHLAGGGDMYGTVQFVDNAPKSPQEVKLHGYTIG